MIAPSGCLLTFWVVLVLSLRFSAAGQTGAAPEPHSLDRYSPLWTAPLFQQPEPDLLPAPVESAPSVVYRLLGMGTTPDGRELAYVQRVEGGPIEEITRTAVSGPVLIGVERRPDGQVDAIVFRKGSDVIRAVASSAPLPDSSAVDYRQRAVSQAPGKPDQMVRMAGRVGQRAVVVPR